MAQKNLVFNAASAPNLFNGAIELDFAAVVLQEQKK